ncbi:MAG: ASPIC/UnbV domain-containing protein [Roseibacillus sp.]
MEKGFRNNKGWKDVDFDSFVVQKQDADGKWFAQSFSGHETNKLFMNQGGESFFDMSALAGLDSDADGRSFVLLDYDRDGWQDLILVNSNSPQLEIFHNEMGRRSFGGRSIVFHLIGGNESSEASEEWSNRDALGAVVTVKVAGKTIMRELRCGEGLGAQNSGMLLVGIGENEMIESGEVRWPSGKRQTLDALEAGMLVTIKERGGIAVRTYNR